MPLAVMTTDKGTIRVEHVEPKQIASRLPAWEAQFASHGLMSLSRHPRWLQVLAEGLHQSPHALEATHEGRTVGFLPLVHMRSRLFGQFLVSLPYLNTAGVITEDKSITAALLDGAVAMADRLDVRYLELRHEVERPHPAFNQLLTSKVHMRLELPANKADLWSGFKPKVRNQIRKGEQLLITAHFGGEALLDDFYAVFSHNMRDLGTPVFGRELFAGVLRHFPTQAELCVLRFGSFPIAGALLLHGPGATEVPSASTLRSHNWTNANMLMYWHLLQRAIEREQRVFDFGRSTVDSNTYRFKKQWGAQAEPAVWQYYVRKGSVEDMRPDSQRNQRLVRIWRHLPLAITRLVGPLVVRGIP